MTCEICGRELPEGTVHWRRFCLDCGQARKLKLQREREAVRRQAAREKRKEPEPPRVKTLSEIAREAARHGMSYGQWVAGKQ